MASPPMWSRSAARRRGAPARGAAARPHVPAGAEPLFLPAVAAAAAVVAAEEPRRHRLLSAAGERAASPQSRAAVGGSGCLALPARDRLPLGTAASSPAQPATPTASPQLCALTSAIGNAGTDNATQA